MRFSNLLILVATFVTGTMVLAQTPTHKQTPTYNLGRAPSEDEIRAMDTIVGPKGKELPPGKGTAKEGEPLFAKKCAMCHGLNGEGTTIAPQIVGGPAIIGNPFATAIWGYIYNAMPRNPAIIGLRSEALTPDEDYAITAFILYKDNVIKEDEAMDEKSLPTVRMPSRNPHLDWLAPANDVKH